MGKIIDFTKMKQDLEHKSDVFGSMKESGAFGDEISTENMYELALELAIALYSKMQEEEDRALLEIDYARDQERVHSNA